MSQQRVPPTPESDIKVGEDGQTVVRDATALEFSGELSVTQNGKTAEVGAAQSLKGDVVPYKLFRGDYQGGNYYSGPSYLNLAGKTISQTIDSRWEQITPMDIPVDNSFVMEICPLTGNVFWEPNSNDDTIRKYDRKGNVTEFMDISYPDGLSFDPNNGLMYFISGDDITKVDREGNVLDTHYHGNVTNSVAVDTDGTVWVHTNFDGLVHYDPSDWSIIEEPGDTNNNLDDFCIDYRDGSFWGIEPDNGYSEYDNSPFVHYDKNVNLLDIYEPQKNYHSISIDPLDFTLWATGFSVETIEKFNLFDSGCYVVEGEYGEDMAVPK